MTIHEPAEKNLKHKTDVMSWADVPWDDCDLNFRPPSLSRLSLSVGAAYGQLLIVASITVCSVAALNRWLVPTIMVETSWMEICVVAVVVSLLSTAGWYRPLPRVFGAQDTAGAGLSVALSVLGFYAIIRLSYGYGLFDVGVVLLFVVAIPSCLLFADQLTGHMLHWWSADPKMSRNTMVVWRNAWCGRFMTQHVEELVALGVHQEQVAVLKRYWMGHVAIIVVYAISTLASLLIGIGEVGLVFLTASTVLMLLVSAWADWQSLGCRQHLAHVLGHWFLYLKDSAQPAWVMQSPAGPQLIRAFQSYAAVSFLAIAFWKLGLAIASTPTRSFCELGSGTATEGVLIGGGAILLAPLHCLLICFVVSAPALSSVEAGLFCDDQPGEGR
jgi:hypothetical protein